MLLVLKETYPKCQIILTSHNTHLLSNKFMRPDCLFILSGKGILTSFCNSTQRELKEEHNLEKCISVENLKCMNDFISFSISHIQIEAFQKTNREKEKNNESIFGTWRHMV